MSRARSVQNAARTLLERALLGLEPSLSPEALALIRELDRRLSALEGRDRLAQYLAEKELGVPLEPRNG